MVTLGKNDEAFFSPFSFVLQLPKSTNNIVRISRTFSLEPSKIIYFSNDQFLLIKQTKRTFSKNDSILERKATIRFIKALVDCYEQELGIRLEKNIHYPLAYSSNFVVDFDQAERKWPNLILLIISLFSWPFSLKT